MQEVSMFTKLIEASKTHLTKGAYQLVYDETHELVQVVHKRNGEVNYEICSDGDEMLMATIIYFGLKN
ncbi:MAG TPA: hypothetical protein PK252_06355 [Bacteroidales bacterium]|nr:hypothetical protein [Bacteroidales bacterium]